VAQVLPGQPSCPNCGARVTARANACPDCGYRFLEDPARPNRRRRRAVALTAGVLAAVALTVFLLARDTEEDSDARLAERSAAYQASPSLDLLSSHPLSTREAERRLEARFTSPRDDDSAAARCSALQPRPAHAIRRCRIRYPGGSTRVVVVLTNPQGQEVLVER
jgi:DNA-directed RNA polymerase subunit RPC12/RpoP